MLVWIDVNWFFGVMGLILLMVVELCNCLEVVLEWLLFVMLVFNYFICIVLVDWLIGDVVLFVVKVMVLLLFVDVIVVFSDEDVFVVLMGVG